MSWNEKKIKLSKIEHNIQIKFATLSYQYSFADIRTLHNAFGKEEAKL